MAVIVILAIIALIATPIILNIINDSKKSSNERSIELYGKAVENAVGNYALKNPEDGNITLDKVEEYIKYKGNEVKCDTTDINSDGTVYLSGCKVDGKAVDYTYGTKKEEVASKICTLASDSEKQGYEIGAKYTCSLDEDRTFYVLENKESSNEITLLMDRNYTDEEVTTMAWCDQSGPNPYNNKCNHDGLDPYIEKIQTKFGSKVQVGIPSKEQIEGAYTGSMPQWAYDYLDGTTNPVSDVWGYWTSTSDSSASYFALGVYSHGILSNSSGVDSSRNGLRPVITISKSLIG